MIWASSLATVLSVLTTARSSPNWLGCSGPTTRTPTFLQPPQPVRVLTSPGLRGCFSIVLQELSVFTSRERQLNALVLGCPGGQFF